MDATVNRKSYYAILALLVIPISGLSVDIYAPSLPAVSHYFHVDKALAQLSITAYMVGLGIMQLFAGPVSDCYGRRKPFLVATLGFLCITLLIPFSHSIFQLLVLRLLQGIVVALTMVPMRSVIPDLFSGRALHSWMTYMTMVWSMGPIIAPAIGGYLQHYWGWKSSFYALAGYIALSGILVSLYLPETSQHRHPLRLSSIISRYITILSNRQYLICVMTNALLYSFMIIFTVVGPFIVQVVLHYTAITFGYIALVIGFAWFLGTMTNRFLLDINLIFKTKICLWLMFCVALCNCLSALYLPLSLPQIIIPIVLMAWLGGIIFPNNFTQAVSLFPTMTASANALSAGFIYILTGSAAAFATTLKSTHLLPLALTYVIFILVCLIITYVRD